MPDFTSQYNTQLTPYEESEFQKWMIVQSLIRGKDIGKDLSVYDIRGLWKSLGQSGVNLQPGHSTDMFKKPSHPTFSNESIYSSPKMQGGMWLDNSFLASPYNLTYQSLNDLQNYFSKVEPNVELVPPKNKKK